jgi:hypothetical protein
MYKLCYAPLPVTTKDTMDDDDDQMILQPLMSNQAVTSKSSLKTGSAVDDRSGNCQRISKLKGLGKAQLSRLEHL